MKTLIKEGGTFMDNIITVDLEAIEIESESFESGTSSY